jgi:hypothetical protein
MRITICGFDRMVMSPTGKYVVKVFRPFSEEGDWKTLVALSAISCWIQIIYESDAKIARLYKSVFAALSPDFGSINDGLRQRPLSMASADPRSGCATWAGD